jgi:hypothetical protein
MTTIPSAEIMFMNELFQESQQSGVKSILNKYIRITGHISSMDFRKKLCVLEDSKNKLKLSIDISLIDFNILQIDSLFQFIGTVCFYDYSLTKMEVNCFSRFFSATFIMFVCID